GPGAAVHPGVRRGDRSQRGACRRCARVAPSVPPGGTRTGVRRVTWLQQLGRHRLLLAGGGIGAILLAFDLWLASAVAPPHVALPDFYVYHLAARIGLAHGWASIYDPSLFQPAVTPVVGRYLPYLNPPLLAWLVAPLTVFPYHVAVAIWLALLGVCLGLTGWLAAPGGVLARLAPL